jgi:N-acetyl-beta-hexosaminidase
MAEENFTWSQQLQGYLLKRIEALVVLKGKRLIGWDENTHSPTHPPSTPPPQ